MAKLTMEEAKDFTVLPENSILDLKIESLEEREVKGRNGTWTKLSFEFKILGIQAIGDGSPVSEYQDMVTEKIFGSVPMKFTDSPENRLRQWGEAILRIEMGVGFELDTSMFKGRMVRGVTSVWMKKVGNEEFPRHQIEALLPMAEQQVAAVQSAPPAAWGQQPDQTAVQSGAPAPAAAPSPVEDPWAVPSTPAAAGAPVSADPWGDWGSVDDPGF